MAKILAIAIPVPVLEYTHVYTRVYTRPYRYGIGTTI